MPPYALGADLAARWAVAQVAHALARVSTLQAPATHSAACEVLLAAAPPLCAFAAVAGGVDGQGARRARAAVAQQAAGVAAAARQRAATELTTRMWSDPTVPGEKGRGKVEASADNG